MRILGVDPGSRVTGWGVIEAQGSRMRHVASGTICASGDEPLAQRLNRIAVGLDEVVGFHKPVEAAVEAVFHARNSKSALTLGHARGAILVTLARHGLDPADYAPTQVKLSLVGRGRADKDQVQSMVRLLLQLDCELKLDESDALALALCHAQTQATPTARRLRDLQRQHDAQGRAE